MRQRLTCLLFSAAMVVIALHYADKVWATSSSGFSSTTLYMGTF